MDDRISLESVIGLIGICKSYVEAKDTREVINITELNAELKTTVAKIDQLRADVDVIVAEIEGSEAQP